MKPFKCNVINVIYLDTTRLFEKLSVMPRGHPATGQEEYMWIKLHKDMHCLWTERKQLLQLKSDNEVALHFLNLPSTSSSAVCDRSQEHRTMPVAQSTWFLRDRNILEVRGDCESTESLCSARPDVSFVGRLSAGNGVEDATSSTLTRYLLTKKV